jgi:hypothetical protein
MATLLDPLRVDSWHGVRRSGVVLSFGRQRIGLTVVGSTHVSEKKNRLGHQIVRDGLVSCRHGCQPDLLTKGPVPHSVTGRACLDPGVQICSLDPKVVSSRQLDLAVSTILRINFVIGPPLRQFPEEWTGMCLADGVPHF